MQLEPGAVSQGCCVPLIWHPSPNFGARRGGAKPDLVVLHYTAMADARGAVDWLCNPTSQVSAHYVLDRDGTLWQLVDEAHRAWHAGAGAWGAVTDVNSRSIGIELVNTGAEPFAEPQMARLEHLLRDVMERWSVPPERVIGHSDLAPGRKIDPGPRFDWQRLARLGLSVWPSPRSSSGPDGPSSPVGEGLLTRLGYTAPASEEAKRAAFLSRFCRDNSDALARAEDLVQRFPVDQRGGTS